MNKKIAIVGSAGLPANYGGFETLVEHLTKNLGRKNDFTVYCSAKNYSQKLNEYNHAKLVYLPLNANGIQSIFYDFISIFKALVYADILLILGVSGCLCLPIVKLLSRKKIIVNIDGLEWKRGKWGRFAKWFLKVSEEIAVKNADIIVADNKIVQDYVKGEYGKVSEMIAYGADHVQAAALPQNVIAKYPFLREPYALTVCRVEPENNLHITLEAMAQQNKWHFVAVGNWSANQYGKLMRSKYKIFERIHLLDPIYDRNMLDQIRSNCVVYIHGHSAGGTNPSLVEAMYLRLPIFAYAVDYNKETTEQCAQYFSNLNELSSFIQRFDDKDLSAIGSKMEEIARRRYVWKIVAERYASLFA